MTPVFRLGSAVVFATAMGMASGDPYAKLCAGDYAWAAARVRYARAASQPKAAPRAAPAATSLG